MMYPVGKFEIIIRAGGRRAARSATSDEERTGAAADWLAQRVCGDGLEDVRGGECEARDRGGCHDGVGRVAGAAVLVGVDEEMVMCSLLCRAVSAWASRGWAFAHKR